RKRRFRRKPPGCAPGSRQALQLFGPEEEAVARQAAGAEVAPRTGVDGDGEQALPFEILLDRAHRRGLALERDVEHVTALRRPQPDARTDAQTRLDAIGARAVQAGDLLRAQRFGALDER